jgi:hypothetical protein
MRYLADEDKSISAWPNRVDSYALVLLARVA